MRIFIDADACPVVGIVEKVAKEHNLPVTLLCDTNHVLSSDYSEVIVVGAGTDAVDYKLISICHKGDIVVSQDYGVAAMALPRPIGLTALIAELCQGKQLSFTDTTPVKHFKSVVRNWFIHHHICKFQILFFRPEQHFLIFLYCYISSFLCRIRRQMIKINRMIENGT